MTDKEKYENDYDRLHNTYQLYIKCVTSVIVVSLIIGGFLYYKTFIGARDDLERVNAKVS